MSVIDTNDITSGYVKHIRSQVGSYLSDLRIKEGTEPLKAVIQDIQQGIRPGYPYIVVTQENNNKEVGGWQRYKTIGDDGFVHFLVEQEITYRITCYGDNSSTILTELQLSCLDDFTRQDIEDLTGATFIGYSDISRIPEYLETEFINTSYMLASFNAVHDYVVTSTGSIERVTGEGRYLRYKGDNQPYVENFDISS